MGWEGVGKYPLIAWASVSSTLLSRVSVGVELCGKKVEIGMTALVEYDMGNVLMEGLIRG